MSSANTKIDRQEEFVNLHEPCYVLIQSSSDCIPVNFDCMCLTRGTSMGTMMLIGPSDLLEKPAAISQLSIPGVSSLYRLGCLSQRADLYVAAAHSNYELVVNTTSQSQYRRGRPQQRVIRNGYF